MPADDIQRIKTFFEDVKSVLSFVDSKKEDLLPSPIHKSFQEALPLIKNKIDNLFQFFNDDRDANYLKNALANVGLTSVQLDLKLNGFNLAYDLWKKAKYLSMVWEKLLENLLEWINIILSSLNFLPNIFFPNINGQPFPIVDPIKEFKDVTEAGLNLKKIIDGGNKYKKWGDIALKIIYSIILLYLVYKTWY